ncbi:terminase large subunit [Gluconacetobacter sp. Hr-1-5]|uniref:terminase large subunit n=1 Tax=Gluconacetobacter sp. Hr-1-5 TaxID=3395370 RepID=UPI003B52E5DB
MTAWDLSCPDWEDRIRTGRSLIPDLPLLNVARADRAARIFDRLRIPDIIGTPPLGKAGGDWFRDIVRALHGSLDTDSMQRAIREIFALVPKKNGKTTYSAAVMLTSLLMNERPLGEFILVAPTKELANIAFGQASGMIDCDKKLKSLCKIQSHLKCITYRPTGATLKIKTFSPDVMTGVILAGALVDEEHVIAEKAEADRVMGQIRGGMISQSDAFLVVISTQSERPPRGVFRADLIKARSIRDGKRTGRTLPIIYEFPADIQKPARVPDEPAPWEDPKHWHMVLPNAGLSITVPRLEEEFAEAKKTSKEELIRWASQHLNVEIGLALRSDRWVGADYWEGAGDPDLTLDELLTRSEVVVAGIDGGGLDDLLSLAVVGRDSVTMEWLHWQRSWVFEGVLGLRKSEASQLRDFERQGDLVIVQEPGSDIEQLADTLRDVDRSGCLAMVGLDPMGVGAVVDALADRQIAGDRVVGVSQGWSLTGAIKTAERKLVDGTLLHGGRPIMAWAVSNAKVEPRGNAIIITKQAAGRLKIDPLMALLNAVVLMSKNPQPQGRSIYERKSLWAC